MSSLNVRIGIALVPEVNPAVDDRWRRVEEYGFAHAWCLDHLAWRDLAYEPWHATVPVLAAAALSTRRIGLGTFVSSPNFRHPVPFAKDVMTLDHVSAGRVVVGLGAGTVARDAAILGTPELSPRERADRYEEFVTLLDLLLRQSPTTWRGDWYEAGDAPTVPLPVQRPRPPFVIAGNGPRGMRLALSYGSGWVTNGRAPFGSGPDAWWPGVAEAARTFDDVARANGGAPDGFRRFLDVGGGPGPATSVAKLVDDLGRMAELGFTDVVLPWPRASAPFEGRIQVIEELAHVVRSGEI